MVRYQPIDAFRGLAILGMVFFSVTIRLSSNLPDVLRHNVWGTVHLGDFILPMFLFASGLSLSYYLQKKEKDSKTIFIKKVIRRFSILALIGISLSIFSAYGFLEMDEVMLSALLFICCVALSKFNWKIILFIIFLINLSYIALIQLDRLDIFFGHYLGGYPAALYYLPIMLAGLTIGKGIISDGVWCERNKTVIFIIFIFFILFLPFIPLNKMTASPTFIMLSILFSFLTFIIVENIISSKHSFIKLDYIGRKPLRYWLMMYIIFIIPLWFYVDITKQNLPLNINWILAIFVSLGLLIFFYMLSRLIEYINISN